MSSISGMMNQAQSFVLSVLSVCFFCTTAGAQTRPPNIVFILADDLGYRELGCFGQQLIRTPNLDRLAAQGMQLTQHYSGNAVCAPSRCVLMTGRHPGHAWVRNNSRVEPEGNLPFPASELTIAEILKSAGYVTGAFGKWGLGNPGSEGDPNNQGFDRFFGYNCQRHAHSYYPSYLWNDDKHIQLRNNPPVPGHASLPEGADPKDPRSYDSFKGTDYAPDHINQQALEFVRQNSDRPFFLYYPTVIPHVALHVPDEELDPYLEKKWNDPPFTRSGGYGYTPHFTPRAAYASMITRMDRYVGRLLDLLRKLEIEEYTIVIFTSDNGTTHLKQEVDFDFFNSVGELRGLKGSLYEGGIRVPAIVRWPGHVRPGSASDRISGFEDWMPTLMEIAGITGAVTKDRDGISLVPTLVGDAQQQRAFLYREFAGYDGQQMIRVGRWKAVRNNLLRRNTIRTELYDLSTDAGEQRDLADYHPALLAQLSALMAREHTPSAQFPIPVLDDTTDGSGRRRSLPK